MNLKKIGNSVLNHYHNFQTGSTELGAICIRPGSTGKPTSCGFVATNMKLKIVDVETGKLLGPNQEGELRANRPYGIIKYYNNPEATKAAFDEEGAVTCKIKYLVYFFFFL